MDQDIGHLSLLFSVTADGTILYSAAETLGHHPRMALSPHGMQPVVLRHRHHDATDGDMGHTVHRA